jgi:hypothetical protein
VDTALETANEKAVLAEPMIALARGAAGTSVMGYMCLTDWRHEIGHNYNGNIIYPSLKALKEQRSCWKQCGVVEVTVEAVRIVSQPQRDLTDEN